MPVDSYRDLIVWQRSIELVIAIYELTATFPSDERYGLASQMQRAAVSIPSNIAEGYRRKSRREYAHFLTFSFGSASELETQIEICRHLQKFCHCDFSRVEHHCQEVLRMLNVMVDKISV